MFTAQRVLYGTLFCAMGAIWAASGSLTGNVTDPQGQRVPDAEIRLAGDDGLRRMGRTSAQGSFSFTGLTAGSYTRHRQEFPF